MVIIKIYPPELKAAGSNPAGRTYKNEDLDRHPSLFFSQRFTSGSAAQNVICHCCYSTICLREQRRHNLPGDSKRGADPYGKPDEKPILPCLMGQASTRIAGAVARPGLVRGTLFGHRLLPARRKRASPGHTGQARL